MDQAEINEDINEDNEKAQSNRHTTGLPPPASWPAGTGFATGRIRLVDFDLVQVSTFEEVWTSLEGGDNNKGITLYKPTEVPAGYKVLSHYGQSNSLPRIGWVLAIKEIESQPIPSPSSSSPSSPPSTPPTIVDGSQDVSERLAGVSLASTKDAVRGEPIGAGEDKSNERKPKRSHLNLPALLPVLKDPSDFRLIWKSSSWGGQQSGIVCIWLPVASEGYSALGYLVTKTEEKPDPSAVTCVRNDHTEPCSVHCKLFNTSNEVVSPLSIWSTRPSVRGVRAKGVNVGSFYCVQSDEAESTLPIACLKNVAFKLDAMPNLEQVQSIQEHYGPTLVYHPSEIFLPSSVSWFFDAGAILYSVDPNIPPIRIASDGSNLPQGGSNDGTFWIDLPSDGTKDAVKRGNLDSAKVYIHVKSVYGGTFTDLASWEFFPFNGPSVAKMSKIDIPLGHVGEHVSDWEHFTLRISNFTGELEAIYFSQHSGGQWVRPYDLEYISGKKALVYVAKSGHPCYAHKGCHLQGDERRGVGLRNDTTMSDLLINTGEKYQIFAAEYMHLRGDPDAPEEPAWLQYMREWGPKIEYDRKKYLDKLLRFLPSKLRNSVEDVLDKLPDEVLGQEGPTGPKEKNMWFGDERS